MVLSKILTTLKTLKKYLPWFFALLFIGGLILSLTNNPIRKKYLKRINAPLYSKIDSIERANKTLRDSIALDTTFVLIKRERDSIAAINDSLRTYLTKLKQNAKQDKKDIDDYGGTFGERLRILSKNLDATY